jgi:hypothetical protein
MSDKAKKILVISSSIVGAALLVLIIYFYLQNKNLKRELDAANKPTPTATVKLVTLTPTPKPSPTPSAATSSTATASAEELINQAIMAKYNLSASDVSIKIEKQTDAAAYGTVSLSGGGGYFVAVKDGDSWKIIADGNGIIECSTLDANNVPASVVSECYDTPSGQDRTR